MQEIISNKKKVEGDMLDIIYTIFKTSKTVPILYMDYMCNVKIKTSMGLINTKFKRVGGLSLGRKGTKS